MARAKKASPAASAAANPGLRYTLLLKGSGGAYAPVPSGTVFHTGDSVRLQLEASDAGYISMFRREASSWDLIASQPAEKGQTYQFPSSGGLQADVPAQMELLLVLSREEPRNAGADALESNVNSHSVRLTLEFR